MKSKAKIVGITGTIGAGKSIVRELFKRLFNVYTYDCDSRAQALYLKPTFRSEVSNILGEDPIDDNGRLKKRLLQDALAIFEQREKIERIIHAAVLTDLQEWIAQHQAERMVLFETAILFSSGFVQLCDQVIIVQADTDIREGRVRQRDIERGTNSRFGTFELLQQREKQLQSKRQNIYTIDNNGKTSLIKQVEQIYSDIMNNQ